MPRRNTHIAIAAISGAAVAYLLAKRAGSSDLLPELLGGALGAAATAMLPDIFEPATSPSHRAGAHSLAAGGLISLGLNSCVRFSEARRADAESRRVLAARSTTSHERNGHQVREFLCRVASGAAIGLPVGYLSHLAADAGTPRGLPLA